MVNFPFFLSPSIIFLIFEPGEKSVRMLVHPTPFGGNVNNKPWMEESMNLFCFCLFRAGNRVILLF